MVEYCEIFKMDFLKILDFLLRLKIRCKAPTRYNTNLVMTEKVKTVIGNFFLLPDFKSRGHPTYSWGILKWYHIKTKLIHGK